MSQRGRAPFEARRTRAAVRVSPEPRVRATERGSPTTRPARVERRGRIGRSFLLARMRLVCLIPTPCKRAAADVRGRLWRAMAHVERRVKTRQNAPVAPPAISRRVLRITQKFRVQPVGSARGIRKKWVSASRARGEHFMCGFVRGSLLLVPSNTRHENSQSEIFQRLCHSPPLTHVARHSPPCASQ
jgi:hypothetical protein